MRKSSSDPSPYIHQSLCIWATIYLSKSPKGVFKARILEKCTKFLLDFPRSIDRDPEEMVRIPNINFFGQSLRNIVTLMREIVLRDLKFLEENEIISISDMEVTLNKDFLTMLNLQSDQAGFIQEKIFDIYSKNEIQKPNRLNHWTIFDWL